MVCRLFLRIWFSKGTLVTLSSPIIQEITGKDQGITAAVVSSELLPGEESYVVYVEFDTDNVG
jgi:hypothetical protein